ncbi:TPM domain-containing protein [Fructobacillus sp. W13]|uniref:TPM domain-containing protein n=1 Tax=Fructobacillus apis TaxID=2935017 RepID=A0ABT0ZPT8_9LACO|nr:TPM domain-containing protein [Fructobacillus apis]MCO0832002.1 TPM domain-containing protein [Fructobacillus apis]
MLKEMNHPFNRRKSFLLLITSTLLFLFTVGMAASADDPGQLKPNSDNPFITDRAKILTDETKQVINQQNQKASQDEKQPQIAVLTVDSTDGMSIADFTNELTLGKNWKVGQKKEDNGILVVFAKNGGQNKIRVATGTGAESYLPDGKIHQLFIKNQENLKSQDMEKVDLGIKQLLLDIEASYNQALGGASEKKDPLKAVKSGPGMIVAGMLAIVLILLIIAVWKSLSSYQAKDPEQRDPSSGAGDFFWGFLLGDLLSSGHHHSSYWDDDDDHFGGGGGFGGGGFGGGDFGGGGSDF